MGTLSPILLLLHIIWCITKNNNNNEVIPSLKMHKQTLIPGILSGVLWNISNVLSLIAIPIIGYSVAYPLLQSAVLVSSLWGIYFFKEMTDQWTIIVFWCSSIILIVGATT